MAADPPPARPAARSRGPRPGLRLGTILGVPVYVRGSWLILAAAVVVLYGPVAQTMVRQLSTVGAYSLALAFVLCLLLSVLLHELGHAIVARRFSIGVRSITLELLGGYTELEGDSPNAPAELFVSLTGPVVSGVLGLMALGLERMLPNGTILDQLAFQLAWSNLIVAVFNALPGLPLDGGRALRAAVWAITGNRYTGSTVAGWIGRLVAVGTASLALLFAYLTARFSFTVLFTLLVAWTLWQGASVAVIQGRVGSRLPGLNLRQLARPVFTVASGTPLAEANRQAVESGHAGAALAVADVTGQVVALVQEQAAAAVPMERRPWVPVESVARTLEPGRTLAVDLAGEDVIRAVQAHPAPDYLVVSGNDVVGVLRTVDLARLLNS
jgi:Zn-dependent protease